MALDNAVTQPRLTQVGILVIAVVAAAIHTSRAAADPQMRGLFVLCAVGFLGLSALLVLPQAEPVRRSARLVTVFFTAATALLYVAWGLSSGRWYLPLGPVSVAVELALLAILLVEARRDVPVEIGAA